VTEPRQYRQGDRLGPAAERARIEAIHNAYPHVEAMPSIFDPSGLVPYPCSHGIPVKPKRFPVTKGGRAWFDDDGNERPPFAGKSWGRSKYLTITSFGGRSGIPYATAQCFVCIGKPVGEDFYVAADGSSLR